MKRKLIRITTVPLSLNKLLEGQLKFINNHYNVIAISSNNKVLKKVGKKEGVLTFNIEMSRKITPIKDIVSLYKMYVFFKKEKPYIVHTHTPKAGVVGMIAGKFAKVPVRLHTVAGLPLLEISGLKRKLLNFVEKITYKCATKVYPNSLGLKRIIEKEKLTKSTKLKIIGNGSSNGIDLQYFNPDNISLEEIQILKSKLLISDQNFVFIFVGRIVGDKGINELISAFKKLNKEFQTTKLLLVGPTEDGLDPIDKETKIIIKNNKNIIYTGYQEDVRPYLSISNALVFPSYREGFPNVVMQAGAMNLPSIVTNINGCNEIITNNFNGNIIEVKNKEALYLQMKNYLTNPLKYNEMVRKTRQEIINKYDRSIFLEELLKEYRTFD